jgi:hypothetical protein
MDGSNLDDLTNVFMHSFMNHRGTSKCDIANRLVSFGANGVNVFQGVQNGVILQL